MTEFRYILKPYKGPASRHTCPACNHRHKFSRYVDQGTGEELADNVGRCDREQSCGYHFTPKQYFSENPGAADRGPAGPHAHPKEVIQRPVEFLPFEIMDRSVTGRRQSDFYPFLARLFREDIADQLCTDYFIGTNKDGNTAFWQVDISGRVRQCKLIKYLPDGHRDKSAGIIFAGKKILGNSGANLQQCFFGEYLLSLPENEGKPVAIVEAEKTAVIASVYFPEFTWIATGGKNGAKWTEAAVCSVLKGKQVILFPDLGAFENWKTKGLLIAAVAGCKVAVSDILELNATEAERKSGLDIADYLVRVQDGTGLALTDFQYPAIWDYSHRSKLNLQTLNQ